MFLFDYMNHFIYQSFVIVMFMIQNLDIRPIKIVVIVNTVVENNRER